jgi:hypothetical protein
MRRPSGSAHHKIRVPTVQLLTDWVAYSERYSFLLPLRSCVLRARQTNRDDCSHVGRLFGAQQVAVISFRAAGATGEEAPLVMIAPLARRRERLRNGRQLARPTRAGGSQINRPTCEGSRVWPRPQIVGRAPRAARPPQSPLEARMKTNKQTDKDDHSIGIDEIFIRPATEHAWPRPAGRNLLTLLISGGGERAARPVARLSGEYAIVLLYISPECRGREPLAGESASAPAHWLGHDCSL